MSAQDRSSPPLIEDPFHSGERYVQDRTNSREMADRNSVVLKTGFDDKVGANIVDADIAAITTRTPSGLRVDLLSGLPGFAELSGQDHVRLNCDRSIPEEVSIALRQAPEIGCVTISFSSRRRARINGRATVEGATLDIAGREVFFNCNKYIATRTPTEQSRQPAQSIEQLVANADTFFVGSQHPERGLDASHRGGHPGVLAMTDGQLRWREYAGNDMFQTLGNLSVTPEIGVLVPDFSSGAAVHFTGTAHIDFEDGVVVTVALESAEASQIGTSRRWELADASPHNPDGDLARP